MELSQLTEIVTGQAAILSRMEEQNTNTLRRLTALESSSGVLTDVKIALSKIEMSNLAYVEKLVDLKVGIEKINNDNKVEHGAICVRLGNIEAVPGLKWNKLSWYILTAVVSGGLTLLIPVIFK